VLGVPMLLWKLLEEVVAGDRVVLYRGAPAEVEPLSESDRLAAVLFGALLHRVGRGRAVAVLVPPMALSRLVLGVHYPSDVVAGSLLGAAVAAGARRVARPSSLPRSTR